MKTIVYVDNFSRKYYTQPMDLTHTLVKWRNALIHTIYMYVLKPIFFLGDPETVHDGMVGVGKVLSRFALGRWIKHDVCLDFVVWYHVVCLSTHIVCRESFAVI